MSTSAVLMLASIPLLVAFINIDERRREHATMFPFDAPVRMALFTMVRAKRSPGLAGNDRQGFLLAGALIADTKPDLARPTTLAMETVIVAITLGVAAGALAPLLAYRKLRNMDIASTLKFTE